NGHYEFGGLCAGSYTVSIPSQPNLDGYVASPSFQGGNVGNDSNGTPGGVAAPQSAPVTLLTDKDTNDTIDFGYEQPVKTIKLEKTANPTTYNAVGQVITYTYKITNTGNVTLTGPFTITDDKEGTISPCGNGPLAPGASTTCTATHTITQ